MFSGVMSSQTESGNAENNDGNQSKNRYHEEVTVLAQRSIVRAGRMQCLPTVWRGGVAKQKELTWPSTHKYEWKNVRILLAGLYLLLQCEQAQLGRLLRSASPLVT